MHDLRDDHDRAAEEPAIAEATLRAALQRIFPPDGGGAVATARLDTRLDELNIDSLVLAELIVELEEEMSVLLELRALGPIETLADLRRALRPIESAR